MLFYGINVWQMPWALLLFVLTTLLVYFAARVMKNGGRKWVFWPVIGMLLATLVFFKCFLGGKYLPVGMSFYCFQLGAYMVQRYRGELEAEKNFLHFALKFGVAKNSLIPLNFLIEMRFFETFQIFWAEKNSEINKIVVYSSSSSSSSSTTTRRASTTTILYPPS